jgi:two-component system cell cycle response regulator
MIGDVHMVKPTILVVDDEAFFRRLFTDILAEEGLYEIECATSGEDALKRIAVGSIDVVVTDMVMPDVCGLDLLRRSRSFDNPPDIILATGNATVETAIQALKNGARDYLLKPCNPDQLRHTVRTILEQRRLLSENTLLRTQIRLYQKGQSLAAQLDIDELFRESVAALLGETGHARALGFVASQHGIAHLTPSPGVEEDSLQTLAEELANRIDEPHKPIQLESKDLSGITDLPEDLRSIWLFPLNAEEDMRGAIALFNAVGADLPDPLPRDAMIFLAEQVLLGFQNACQFKGARELIYADDLTGLYNHRYLHIALEQEIRRAERFGLEFSVAFIDLDMFKNVNDTHGHLVGSNVLKEVGQILRQCVRDADLLFRYGGDEFTALLIETDSHGAKVVAERIRKKINDHAFQIINGQACKITATVGYATYPIHATGKNDLIELADKAMYQGKHQRNATCSASEVHRK